MRPDKAVGFRGDIFPNFNEERSKRRQRSSQGVYRPGVVLGLPAEALEQRRLLSYSWNSGTGVLTFNGTTGNDTIIAYRVNNAQGDNVFVRRNDATPEIVGPFASSAVTKVIINGDAGDDHISAERASPFTHGNAAWNEVLEINGNDGSDQLHGGDLADTIKGGDDSDDLWGYEGNDLMYGGYGGADGVDGGPGNDTMYGGDGGAGGNDEVEPDVIWGGEGSDVIYGEGGGDDLFGGPDGDAMYGGEGDDELTGEDGNDYLSGNAGNDTFWAADNSTFVDSLLGGAGSDAIGDIDSGFDTLLDTIPG